jgi:hypothetical protein
MPEVVGAVRGKATERHADVVKQSTARKSLDLGLRNYTRQDLEAARRAGEMLEINVWASPLSHRM